jgi:hypothetical protein
MALPPISGGQFCQQRNTAASPVIFLLCFYILLDAAALRSKISGRRFVSLIAQSKRNGIVGCEIREKNQKKEKIGTKIQWN